jgi:hypothetical protein
MDPGIYRLRQDLPTPGLTLKKSSLVYVLLTSKRSGNVTHITLLHMYDGEAQKITYEARMTESLHVFESAQYAFDRERSIRARLETAAKKNP